MTALPSEPKLYDKKLNVNNVAEKIKMHFDNAQNDNSCTQSKFSQLSQVF